MDCIISFSFLIELDDVSIDLAPLFAVYYKYDHVLKL